MAYCCTHPCNRPDNYIIITPKVGRLKKKKKRKKEGTLNKKGEHNAIEGRKFGKLPQRKAPPSMRVKIHIVKRISFFSLESIFVYIYIYYTQRTTSTSTGATKEDYTTTFFCNFLHSIGFLLISSSLDFFTGFCRHLDPHLEKWNIILCRADQNFVDATRFYNSR